jgi:hypothetical protein
MKNYRRVFLYLSAIFVMMMALSQIKVMAVHDPCCATGSECSGTLKCCAPDKNEAICSENRKYYCRAACPKATVLEPGEDVPVGDVPVQTAQ